ncbi:MAG: 2-phospho-L-lactate guanylyltransferase [Anaerolinea sp.]|nr:2-phospho-L-lactate guanylyltransferase [Anaerolinea sp.]
MPRHRYDDDEPGAKNATGARRACRARCILVKHQLHSQQSPGTHRSPSPAGSGEGAGGGEGGGAWRARTSGANSERLSLATAVLIPLKAPSEAKERLAGILDRGERRELAITTFRGVVEAVLAAGLELAVVTPDVAAAAGLLTSDATLIAESPVASGLSAQIEYALAQPSFASFEHVLILHADLPLATPEALRALAGRADAGVTMVESADGGTNALLAPLPLDFDLQYGSGSYAKHRTAAAAAGLAVHRFASPALALDLDTPEDIRALLEHPEGAASPAGQLLLRWGLPARLAARGMRNAE